MATDRTRERGVFSMARFSCRRAKAAASSAIPPASITPSCSACGDPDRTPNRKKSPCTPPTAANTRLAVLTAFGEANSIDTFRLRGQTSPAREI
jgi:hypothetical protein